MTTEFLLCRMHHITCNETLVDASFIFRSVFLLHSFSSLKLSDECCNWKNYVKDEGDKIKRCGYFMRRCALNPDSKLMQFNIYLLIYNLFPCNSQNYRKRHNTQYESTSVLVWNFYLYILKNIQLLYALHHNENPTSESGNIPLKIQFPVCTANCDYGINEEGFST